MLEMKPFSHEDWYGFAGAERFSDGTEPLIGHLELEDSEYFEAVVILDGNGLSVQVLQRDGAEESFFTWDMAAASRALAFLTSAKSFADISAIPGREP